MFLLPAMEGFESQSNVVETRTLL